MAILEFQDLKFEDKEELIRVNFMKIFFFDIEKKELEKLGRITIQNKNLELKNISQEKAEKQFNKILTKSFPKLKNKITDNATLYIHKNSDIPLVGSLSFGIVDKGSDMLELKPLTSCNISCIFCSVDEGPKTGKMMDIVVEKDYLVQETEKILKYKKQPIDIYINPQGEPLLYSDIIGLISDLSRLEYIKNIYIITNATLLNEELANKLIKAGLTGFSISINSIDKENSKKFSGDRNYNIEKIKEVLKKIKDKTKITLTPVFMNKVNEKDIEDLIKYSKENDFEIMIQNFLLNRRGRKPTKEIPFERFFEFLKKMENKYGIQLIKQGKITKTKELPKPFKKNDIVEAEIFSEGRYKNEILAKAQDRIITLKGFFDKKKKVKVKITKDKYNIFHGIES